MILTKATRVVLFKHHMNFIVGKKENLFKQLSGLLSHWQEG